VTAIANITIRKTQDFFTILSLNEQIFSESESIDVSNNIFGWIARDGANKKSIGFCTATNIGSGILYLSRSGLLSGYRGRGLQRRFVRIRERFARQNKFQTVITYVHPENHSSFVTLIKMGYEIYDPEYDYVGDEFIYLRKNVK